jgi:hypothetical protein
MSELSEQSRQRAKEKVERLTRSTTGAVDASGWKEPLGEKGGVQTGMRVVSRRAYRAGGKVQGHKPVPRADRQPRMRGGPLVDDLANVDMKKANDFRDGEKHEGGLKAGGRAKKLMGGQMSRPMPIRPEMRPETPEPMRRPMLRAKGGKTETHDASCACSRCYGGRAGKAAGGKSVADGTLEGARPKGGRLARKSGGSAKKGMNVNIIIAPPQGKPAMPMVPPGAPVGAPVGLHQSPPPSMPPLGAPMPQGAQMPPPQMRKSGGRAYPLTGGGGGGLGRREKAIAYG